MAPLDRFCRLWPDPAMHGGQGRPKGGRWQADLRGFVSVPSIRLQKIPAHGAHARMCIVLPIVVDRRREAT
jgi:hypothetical protein